MPKPAYHVLLSLTPSPKPPETFHFSHNKSLSYFFQSASAVPQLSLVSIPLRPNSARRLPSENTHVGIFSEQKGVTGTGLSAAMLEDWLKSRHRRGYFVSSPVGKIYRQRVDDFKVRQTWARRENFPCRRSFGRSSRRGKRGSSWRTRGEEK